MIKLIAIALFLITPCLAQDKPAKDTPALSSMAWVPAMVAHLKKACPQVESIEYVGAGGLTIHYAADATDDCKVAAEHAASRFAPLPSK